LSSLSFLPQKACSPETNLANWARVRSAGNDTGRPITAAFAGAPGNSSFTVFGATPLRNAAVVGLQATTTIAAATQIYLRYDGEIATGTDNHALNVGVRFTW
jgi:uncharacterized protein with beta-barrel porin domain